MIMRRQKFDIEEISIRLADESDADALALLVSELGYPTDASTALERLNEIIKSDDCVLVAVYNKKAVGMAVLHRTRFLHRRTDGRISTLVVSDDFRGRNIGARLIEKAETIFREWGCSRVEITSGKQRAAAHRFYQRAGYVEQPKRFIKLLAK